MVQRAIGVGVHKMILTGASDLIEYLFQGTNVPESIESYELAKTMPGVFYSTAGELSIHSLYKQSRNSSSRSKIIRN